MKLNIPRISDPFASEISDEEDLPDFGKLSAKDIYISICSGWHVHLSVDC